MRACGAACVWHELTTTQHFLSAALVFDYLWAVAILVRAANCCWIRSWSSCEFGEITSSHTSISNIHGVTCRVESSTNWIFYSKLNHTILRISLGWMIINRWCHVLDLMIDSETNFCWHQIHSWHAIQSSFAESHPCEWFLLARIWCLAQYKSGYASLAIFAISLKVFAADNIPLILVSSFHFVVSISNSCFDHPVTLFVIVISKPLLPLFRVIVSQWSLDNFKSLLSWIQQ